MHLDGWLKWVAMQCLGVVNAIWGRGRGRGWGRGRKGEV